MTVISKAASRGPPNEQQPTPTHFQEERAIEHARFVLRTPEGVVVPIWQIHPLRGLLLSEPIYDLPQRRSGVRLLVAPWFGLACLLATSLLRCPADP